MQQTEVIRSEKIARFECWHRNSQMTGSGVTVELKIHPETYQSQVWLDLLSQKGPTSFDSNGIRVKIGESDLQEMMAVLRGRKLAAGILGKDKPNSPENYALFHKSSASPNDIISLIAFRFQEDRQNFLLQIRQTKSGTTTAKQISLSIGEAIQLEMLFEEALKSIMRYQAIKSERSRFAALGSSSDSDNQD